ncbi:putative membrane protein YccC [Variovorax boronicumulans]|uniref:Membrane protein YccC n=1 Tax=Variovorax boronicumulans TaxID=436515 RepID=A0AAW8D3Q3_9BURK|nr:FUSC family protein [Variovorax boronicumulans]MDP9894844.1 putative membrane protein YccC [Variovorax boronicumulans]MDQ0054836.1 putative membrane protein YccC [Variovorax boronicumulans]
MIALPRFSRQELLFSLKSFVAAMFALYLSSRFGLPRPFWAMMTAYIVAHPLASHVRSKALYRFLGTLLGCAATVVLVPSLSGSPELLSLALALWVGLCLYVSLLDRSARSYVFMLAGYSAALIGFPLVEAPAEMFDTAVARATEIGLGILCACVVHGIAFPAGLAPSLLGVMDRALGDARQWLTDLLREPPTEAMDARMAADRQRLAMDITQLRLLSTHVRFDAGLRWSGSAIGALQDRLAALTPLLSAVEDRLQTLCTATGSVPEDIGATFAQHSGCLVPSATNVGVEKARVAFRAIADGPAASAWIRALRIDLATRLEELVAHWEACTTLRNDIDAGIVGNPVALRRTAAPGGRMLHLDRGLALRSAITAVLGTCLSCALWIATGWPSGSAMAMGAAVFCSFFATLDDPVPAMHKFITALLWSLPVSAFYVLGVMPLAHDFGMLVLCIAPVFLVVGCYMARPASSLSGLGMFFGVAGTLALQDTATADWVSFIGSNLALFMGAVIAARVTALMRSVERAWTVRRIRRATWHDLGDLAAHPQDASARDAFASRMLDRIALLAPRIAPDGAEAVRIAAHRALRELRMGVDIAALQQHRARLPDEPLSRLLSELALVFRAQLAGAPPRHAPLLPYIDRLLLDALTAGAERPAVAALVGLRRNLFPIAPPALQP